jgi:hypothetical protein
MKILFSKCGKLCFKKRGPAGYSETLVFYITAQCHNPEDGSSKVLRNLGITGRCHNTEDHDFKSSSP